MASDESDKPEPVVDEEVQQLWAIISSIRRNE